MKKKIIIDQLAANLVETLNITREQALELVLATIKEETLAKLSSQDEAFIEAMRQIEELKKILSKPENILGSEATKHGEIAELIEVYIRNAKDILEGKNPTASINDVGRTSPIDYILDGTNVQSKFCRSLNETLTDVIEHMEKYNDFYKDGLYKIPSDQFELLVKIINGESLDGISQRTIDSVLEKIAVIERLTGKSINDIMGSSISTYDEVQTNNVDNTTKKYEDEITNDNEQRKSDINKEEESRKNNAVDEYSPSVKEALKAGAIAAVIGGTVSAGVKIYTKYRFEKKSIGEFSTEDWKEVGLDFAKGGARGGISGVSIYGMTNYTNIGAPMAGAFISSSIGVAVLAKKYNAGEINSSDFVVEGQILCLDAGLTALGGALGQTLIPIPILGAMIGCMATQVLTSIGKNYLSKKDYELLRSLEAEYMRFENQLDYETKCLIKEINDYYDSLGGLLLASQNAGLNYELKFNLSIDTARFVGIKEEEILKSKEEIDDYFLN